MPAERQSRTMERDTLLSGGGWRTSASRSGFLPVPIACVPVEALRGIAVYIRVRSDARGQGDQNAAACFRLYCGEGVPFTEGRLRKLAQNRVRFLYLRVADHERYREQVEDSLDHAAADQGMSLEARSSLVYETSVELVNELVSDRDLASRAPRVGKVARAVAGMVIKDPGAFRHLFAASHHDFYTATHMVNVGTWMVSLAYAMGVRSPDELSVVCQAGMVHDIGKIDIPKELLNKAGELTDDEWRVLRAHPVTGAEHLSACPGLDPAIIAVARQHHERMDGSGYPDKLRGNSIHAMARICAVVDSFDAMTAVRPFRERTLTVAQALDILRAEAPTRYDAGVVEAWGRLVGQEKITLPTTASPEAPEARLDGRSGMHCRARLHILVWDGRRLRETPGSEIIVHSISSSGVGFLSQLRLRPGSLVRLFLFGPERTGRPIEGQTVRCHSYSDRWHEVGVAICDPLAVIEGDQAAAA